MSEVIGYGPRLAKDVCNRQTRDVERVPSKSPDIGMACLAANGFYKQAEAFFSKIPKDLNESAAFVYQKRGELVAAVTSMAFAVELYLKALAIASALKAEKTHNLLDLFDRLPDNVRASVEAKFTAAINEASPDSIDAIELGITTTPFPPTAEECAAADAQRPPGDDVRALLDREKDAFRSWRYIYESKLPKGVTIFRVDFHRVALLANALRQHLQVESTPHNAARSMAFGASGESGR